MLIDKKRHLLSIYADTTLRQPNTDVGDIWSTGFPAMSGSHDDPYLHLISIINKYEMKISNILPQQDILIRKKKPEYILKFSAFALL